MRQKRIRLSLTRHDAAALLSILTQAVGDEPGMLIAKDAEIADRIAGRLLKLLQPRSRLTSIVVEPRPSGGFQRAENAGKTELGQTELHIPKSGGP